MSPRDVEPGPCLSTGWKTEGIIVPDSPVISNLAIGPHQLTSTITLKKPGAVFFEVASTNAARVVVNTETVLNLESPFPGLQMKTVFLAPGTYDVSVDYLKTVRDSYLSVRVYFIDVANPVAAEALPFCSGLNKEKDQK